MGPAVAVGQGPGITLWQQPEWFSVKGRPPFVRLNPAGPGSVGGLAGARHRRHGAGASLPSSSLGFEPPACLERVLPLGFVPPT